MRPLMIGDLPLIIVVVFQQPLRKQRMFQHWIDVSVKGLIEKLVTSSTRLVTGHTMQFWPRRKMLSPQKLGQKSVPLKRFPDKTLLGTHGSSKRGELITIVASFENAFEWNNTFHESNAHVETWSNIPKAVKELSSRNTFWPSTKHSLQLRLTFVSKHRIWVFMRPFFDLVYFLCYSFLNEKASENKLLIILFFHCYTFPSCTFNIGLLVKIKRTFFFSTTQKVSHSVNFTVIYRVLWIYSKIWWVVIQLFHQKGSHLNNSIA